MDAGNGRTLRTEFGPRVPARVEEHEKRTDVVTRGDGKKLIESLTETGGILLPEQIMQEHPHGIHAKAFGPAEFFLDLIWVKGAGLPHLQLVDRGLRDVVTADKPRLTSVPIVSFLFGPTGGLGESECGDEA